MNNAKPIFTKSIPIFIKKKNGVSKLLEHGIVRLLNQNIYELTVDDEYLLPKISDPLVPISPDASISRNSTQLLVFTRLILTVRTFKR